MSETPVYGFITVVDVPELGYSGGLLVLSDRGKPIEFHCTAPVRENRAQKILYGSTYRRFIYLDQIASSLIAKLNRSPDIFITDASELNGISEQVAAPVVYLVNTSDEASDQLGQTIGDVVTNVCSEDLQQQHDATLWCQQFAAQLPLDEPLERIRQAIDEAQAVAR